MSGRKETKRYTVADSTDLKMRRARDLANAMDGCEFVFVGVTSKQLLHKNISVSQVEKYLVNKRDRSKSYKTVHPNQSGDFEFYFGSDYRIAGLHDDVKMALKSISKSYSDSNALTKDNFGDSSEVNDRYADLLGNYNDNRCTGSTWTLDDVFKAYEHRAAAKWVSDTAAIDEAERLKKSRGLLRREITDLLEAMQKNSNFANGAKAVDVAGLEITGKVVTGKSFTNLPGDKMHSPANLFHNIGSAKNPLYIIVPRQDIVSRETKGEGKKSVHIMKMFLSNWAKLARIYPDTFTESELERVKHERQKLGTGGSKKGGKRKAARDLGKSGRQEDEVVENKVPSGRLSGKREREKTPSSKSPSKQESAGKLEAAAPVTTKRRGGVEGGVESGVKKSSSRTSRE